MSVDGASSGQVGTVTTDSEVTSVTAETEADGDSAAVAQESLGLVAGLSHLKANIHDHQRRLG